MNVTNLTPLDYWATLVGDDASLPVFEAASVTPRIVRETCSVQLAASWTPRVISRIAVSCSSTAEAMVVVIVPISAIVAAIPRIA